MESATTGRSYGLMVHGEHACRPRPLSTAGCIVLAKMLYRV